MFGIVDRVIDLAPQFLCKCAHLDLARDARLFVWRDDVMHAGIHGGALLCFDVHVFEKIPALIIPSPCDGPFYQIVFILIEYTHQTFVN